MGLGRADQHPTLLEAYWSVEKKVANKKAKMGGGEFEFLLGWIH